MGGRGEAVRLEQDLPLRRRDLADNGVGGPTIRREVDGDAARVELGRRGQAGQTHQYATEQEEQRVESMGHTWTSPYMRASWADALPLWRGLLCSFSRLRFLPAFPGS